MGTWNSRATPVESNTHELTLSEVEKRRPLLTSDLGFLRVVPHGVYADLSAHVYQFRGVDTASTAPVNATAPLPEGWQVLMDCASINLNKEGYYAVAYVHSAWRQCIIAQRGTTEVMGVRAAAWIYFEEATIQFFLAEQFSKQVRAKLNQQAQNESAEDWCVTYTGHSLGAVIATHRALEEATLAITFEPPGCRSFVQKLCTPEMQTRVDSCVITYLQAPNLINSLKPHCGYVVTIAAETAKNPTSLLFPITTPSRGAEASSAAGGAGSSPAAAIGGAPPSGSGGTSSGSASPGAGAARQGFRLRLPSIRPQEYLREYVLGSVGMGVPELQQYVSKVEPVLREMIEHSYQLHSIQEMRQFFAKEDEPAEEQVVVHWPSHFMQFLEYHNTTRALKDPENAAPHVRAAYTAMLRRLCCTKKRDKHRLPQHCVSRDVQNVVRLWWLADARARQAMPISVIDHKALNVIRLDQGELVTTVMTAFQAKHYLERLVRRPEIADLLRHPPVDLAAPSAHAPSKL